MTECTRGRFAFPALKRRQVEAEFSSGNISSDSGLLLLRQIDKRPGLLEAVNALLPDPRDQRYVQHDQLTLLRQRVYALCQGYEDLMTITTCGGDPAFQTAVRQDEYLGSSPTLYRLENRADRVIAVAIHRVLTGRFIASHKEPLIKSGASRLW